MSNAVLSLRSRVISCCCAEGGECAEFGGWRTNGTERTDGEHNKYPTLFSGFAKSSSAIKCKSRAQQDATRRVKVRQEWRCRLGISRDEEQPFRHLASPLDYIREYRHFRKVLHGTDSIRTIDGKGIKRANTITTCTTEGGEDGSVHHKEQHRSSLSWKTIALPNTASPFIFRLSDDGGHKPGYLEYSSHVSQARNKETIDVNTFTENGKQYTHVHFGENASRTSRKEASRKEASRREPKARSRGCQDYTYGSTGTPVVRKTYNPTNPYQSAQQRQKAAKLASVSTLTHPSSVQSKIEASLRRSKLTNCSKSTLLPSSDVTKSTTPEQQKAESSHSGVIRSEHPRDTSSITSTARPKLSTTVPHKEELSKLTKASPNYEDISQITESSAKHYLARPFKTAMPQACRSTTQTKANTKKPPHHRLKPETLNKESIYYREGKDDHFTYGKHAYSCSLRRMNRNKSVGTFKVANAETPEE